MSLESVARPDSVQSLGLKQIALALAPIVLALLWTSAVRLPFFFVENGDEYFFSIVADQWLHGGLPYITAFDVKPPGLFLIYAAVQSVFGASHVVTKWMEIGAVAFGAYAMYVMLRAHGTRRVAIWAAILYPVYTLAFDGATSVNMVLQLPLIILSFSAILSAVRNDRTLTQRIVFALLAGISIGAAGTIKQTAAFEALAMLAVVWIYGDRRVALSAVFAVGAALPIAGFSLYYLAAGHFHEMFQDVVVMAMHRVNDAVAAGYGPDLAYYFTPLGMMQNAVLRSGAVVFLWGGAAFALLRRDIIRTEFPTRVLIACVLWLVAAFAGAVTSHMLVDYYLLTIVPPLIVIAGAFFCHGLKVAPRYRSQAFVFSLVAASLALLVAGREGLFSRNPAMNGDSEAMWAVSAKLLALQPASNDRLFVVNRGPRHLHRNRHQAAAALLPSLASHRRVPDAVRRSAGRRAEFQSALHRHRKPGTAPCHGAAAAVGPRAGLRRPLLSGGGGREWSMGQLHDLRIPRLTRGRRRPVLC